MRQCRLAAIPGDGIGPAVLLMMGTRSNAQRFGMVMCDEIFYEVARGYADVKTDRELVDAATTRLVRKPDLGGHATMRDVTKAVCGALRG